MMDAISKAAEPLWQTPAAVLDSLANAHAGTLLFSLFVFVAALELLRASAGFLAILARAIAVLALMMAAATALYGDYLAPPAQAMLTRVGLQERHQDRALVAMMGVAAMGAAYGAGRLDGGPQRGGMERAPRRAFAWTRSEAVVAATSVAERLQQRQAARNPKRLAQRVYRGPRLLRG